MLTSWFGQKSPKEFEQSRRSYDALSGTPNPPHLSLDTLSPRLVHTSPQPRHTTPHDAILAQMQSSSGAEPISPYAGDDDRRSLITPISPAASHSRLDLGLSPAPSMYTNATTTNPRQAGTHGAVGQQIQNVDLLLDPFDGTSHGILFPQENSIGPQDEIQPVPRFNAASVAAASEGMWSHLSKVLDLQSQIAKLHIDMEGIGAGDGRKKANGMGRGGSMLREDRRAYHVVPSLRARAMSNASTIGTVGDEKGNDEEGVGVADEETEKNRAREEEFAKLANQFEGKKESIREMMNKLDDLSKALTEFHALQAPDVSISKHTSMATVSPSPPFVGARPNSSLDYHLERAPHVSLSPPRMQLHDNMLWAPPKPRTATPGAANVLPESLSRLAPTKEKGALKKHP